MSPVRAILLHSPGRKPWVRHWYTFFEPRRGGTNRAHLDCVVAVRDFASSCIYPLGHLLTWVSVAPKGAHFTFICRYPGFHIGLCPHSTLGFAGVSCLKALIRENYYIVQRLMVIVNFDALALRFMSLNIGRIDEVIYKYFCVVLGQTQPRGIRPK